jgi:pimeloyl-ACP methyl ester carboxylesterase
MHRLGVGTTREMRSVVTDRVREVEVPAYFLHGRHDRTSDYGLARDYVTRLVAPVKGLYTFPRSAHGPIFEEPDRVSRILRADVLNGRSTLADPVVPLRESGTR